MANLKKLNLSELQMLTKDFIGEEGLLKCINREFKKNDYVELIVDLRYYDTYSEKEKNETKKKWQIKNPTVLDYLQRFI